MCKAPCMECEKRHEKCHATCQMYREFRRKVELARKNGTLYDDVSVRSTTWGKWANER